MTYGHLYAGHQLGSYKAPNLYVWNYYTRTLWRATGDVVIAPYQDLREFSAPNLVLVKDFSAR